MISKSVMGALAVLLLCTACTDASTSRTSTTGLSSMQMSSVRWDDMAPATQSAKVINGSLIFMR
jgi:DMSO/TMAO reductase YedYZ molybdopterin-dependent catalytic subunit